VIFARRRRATPQAPEQQPKRPLEDLSDADLQQNALSVATVREATITEALVRGPLREEKRITRLSRATLDQRTGSPGISAYDLHRSTSAHQRRI
jgi:hypothetical protein